MLVTVDAEGKTRVRDKFTVTAPIAGKMSRVRVIEGDNVPHEYLITEIDPNPPLPRIPDETAGRPSPYTAKVYAPASGKVLRVFEKNERMVTAGMPILEIGDPSRIEIVIDILSTQAVNVRPGALILIDAPEKGEQVKARVRLVESQAITKVSALGVEEQRVNVIGDFQSGNAGFGDNFRVDSHIVVWGADDVLTVPASALFRYKDQWSVFVIEGAKARLRNVSVGQQNAEWAQIIAGLQGGESVIMHPPSQLADGHRVEIR
jgi:HlyD family secretion protein